MTAGNDAPPKRTPRKVSLDDDLGKQWRAKRIEKGYSVDHVATIVGVSNGTVSNVELGKQKTLPGPKFLRWRRLLYSKASDISREFERVSDVTGDMTEEQLSELTEHALIIKRRKR